MGDVKTWVMVANLLFMVLWALFTWWSAKGKAESEEVASLRERVLVLEQQYQHMPDHKLVQQLATNMGIIRAELEGLRNEFRPLVKQLDRVNDFLLAHK